MLKLKEKKMENQSTHKKSMSYRWIVSLFLASCVLFCNDINAQDVKSETNQEVESEINTNQATDRKASFSSTTELSGFEGNVLNCFARLIWTTTIQDDLDHFDVEWSGDGIVFMKIAEVDAFGSANGGWTYNFTDESTSEFNFYRLKMVDVDGNFTYSEVIEIVACEEEIPPQIFPNPVAQLKGAVNIKFFAQREEALIVVMDLGGTVVKRLSLGVMPNSWNNMQLNISDLPPGNYFVVQPGTKGGTAFIIN